MSRPVTEGTSGVGAESAVRTPADGRPGCGAGATTTGGRRRIPPAAPGPLSGTPGDRRTGRRGRRGCAGPPAGRGDLGRRGSGSDQAPQRRPPSAVLAPPLLPLTEYIRP